MPYLGRIPKGESVHAVLGSFIVQDSPSENCNFLNRFSQFEIT